jgi:hypothetical protein
LTQIVVVAVASFRSKRKESEICHVGKMVVVSKESWTVNENPPVRV